MHRSTEIAIALLFIAIVYLWIKGDDNNTRLNQAESQIHKLNNIVDQVNQDRLQEVGNQLNQFLPHFDPNEKGYTKIESGCGNFLIICDQVEAYSNGFKLHIRIGNPNYIIFKDSTFSLSYGDGLKSVKSIIPNMMPGTWTNFEVIMAPASPDDLNKISVQLTTSDIFLIKQPIIQTE